MNEGYLCRKADGERGFIAQEFFAGKREWLGKAVQVQEHSGHVGVAYAHTGRSRAGEGALLEAIESGEIGAAKPAVCALAQPRAATELAGSLGIRRELHTGRKTAICPRDPPKPCGAGAGRAAQHG